MDRNIVKCTILISLQMIKCMSVQKHSNSMDNNEPENDMAEFIVSKGYLPNEKNLPAPSVKSKSDNDMPYILSKLNDEELIRLLISQPKKDIYDLNDIVKIAFGDKTIQRESEDEQSTKKYQANTLVKLLDASDPKSAFYRLNHRQVFSQDQKPTTNLYALKKLHTLLYNRPRQGSYDETLSDEKRELLFDILVAQLKTLCCKGTSDKHKYQIQSQQLHAPLENFMEKRFWDKSLSKSLQNQINNEFMFLILNEEIKSKNNEDLIMVDPETLEKNSSVLLLGPITTPLTNDQLKTVMNRISNELLKPEYASLLQQLSGGTFNDRNSSVVKNLIRGPDTRRYIKAHRCNHQSKLARIYGGPKWLICTGYLNINTPNLYD